ncbi:hypothetical protein ACFL5O_09565, partial [Myxococcota bacterium]
SCDCQAQSRYRKSGVGSFSIRQHEFFDEAAQSYPYCAQGDSLSFRVSDESGLAPFVVTLRRQP